MTTRTIRCAVYTRKSSEEGLEQAFNSLDAQREAGHDYIKSQKHQGWLAVTTAYDDGGYSGGTMERPGLQQLLADIQRGRIDVVVVYKVDRLSRSLADFARLMQIFDEHRVSFVSVTQQFNTTTSMGRLTLNMLLSFAQFEREVAGERIRDKIAATKRKGVWVCGKPPLGYILDRNGNERQLRIVEPEAKLVRAIFDHYAACGSPLKTAQAMNALLAKHAKQPAVFASRRRAFDALQIYRLITNPIYVGKIAHTRMVNGESVTQVFDGQHQPIIERSVWDRVQAKMVASNRETRHRWTHTHLLKGKLRTSEDFAMSPASVQRVVKRDGKRTGERRLVRYYVSQKAIKQGYASCPIKTINATRLDELVRALVCDHLLAEHTLDLASHPADLRDRWVRQVLARVVLAPESIRVELASEQIEACREALLEARAHASTKATTSVPPAACPFTPEVEPTPRGVALTLRLQIKRLDGKRMLVSPTGEALVPTPAAEASEHLRFAIGRAFAYQEELRSKGCTVRELGKRVGLSEGRVSVVLLLTRLSPQILKRALSGTLPREIGVDDLTAAASELDWSRQASRLGI
ncbi:MAG: recombinase family protein [Planctomycetota bacterium]|nr:recombinase family protein [Planctomycetota bacterium]